jgi:hypothetical protein
MTSFLSSGWHAVFLAAFFAAFLAASISASHAGPCSDAIGRMQARLDARLAARVGTGPTVTESSTATLHHQPTPGSIAAVEEQLGAVSPEKVQTIQQAMARARAADDAGDKNGCEQALADVQHDIGP